jgi:hypothetical protein
VAAPAKPAPKPIAPKPKPEPVVVQKPAPTPAKPAAPVPVAPPPVAPVPVAAAEPVSPKEACGKRVFLALSFCMQTQCAKPQFTNHAQCVQMRQEQKDNQERFNNNN